MNTIKTQGTPPDLNEKHQSDGTELIPAEVQATMRHNEVPEPIDDPAAASYTVNDEGLIDNYAIEPDVYPAAYPSPRQQRNYAVMAAGAALFVVTLVLISFAVS